MKYDVIIIGAGPGGIFSAYELVQQNPDLKIAVFESGHPLEKRHCPIDGDKIKSCINCKSCSIMSGFGGAGAFSDGKYNITNAFGGTLYEYIGKSQAIDLMKYVDDINMKFGGEGTKLYSTAGTSFKKIFKQNKLNHKAMSIPDFRSACHDFAQHYVGVQMDAFKRMGVIGDWEHPYLTMNPGFEAEEVKVFLSLIHI